MHDSLAEISTGRFLLVLGVTGVLVAAVGVGSLVLTGLVLGTERALSRDAVLFTVALATACIPVPVAWLIVRRARQPWLVLGWRAARPRHVLLAVVVAFAYLMVGALAYRALGLEQALDSYLKNDLGQYFGTGQPDGLRLAAFFLIVGPLAAIAEEVFFRGFIFGWLRQRMSVLAAAAISAAVFSAVHFNYLAPGGVLGMAAAADIFVTGLLLAWLYQTSGSLAPPIVMHAVNNMTIILFVVYVL